MVSGVTVVFVVTPADPFSPRPLQEEWIFTYSDSSGQVALSFGCDHDSVRLIVGGVSCSMDSIISASHFTSYMKPFCILWASSSGQVGVYVDGTFRTETCSTSIGHLVPAGGRFQLGGQCDVSTGSASSSTVFAYSRTISGLQRVMECVVSCDRRAAQLRREHLQPAAVGLGHDGGAAGGAELRRRGQCPGLGQPPLEHPQQPGADRCLAQLQ